ncbi:hypothetical protein [Lysinibacillus antri]|nr:hypothetical protein [Lysinibacillus antri]
MGIRDVFAGESSYQKAIQILEPNHTLLTQLMSQLTFRQFIYVKEK